MNEYYHDYRQIIIDRFCDDCRCMVLKDKDGNIIDSAYFYGDGLQIKYEDVKDNESIIISGWNNMIEFISKCNVEED